MRVDIGGGVRLYFDVEGLGLVPDGPTMRDKPTMILLHGGPGSDHVVFKPWWTQFADTHQVVFLDHRGQGRSDGWDSPATWTLDTWADDVVRFCEALEIERPVVVGHSFGGIVAMRYAGRHPDHPSRLVISSAPARFDLEARVAAFERLGGPEAAAIASRYWSGDTTAAAEYLERCAPLYNRHHHRTADDRGRSKVNAAVAFHWMSGEELQLDLRDTVARISCPTLVLSGADDPTVPPSTQHELVGALRPKLVTFELMDDCGHGTYRDQPERTVAALRSFLAGSTNRLE